MIYCTCLSDPRCCVYHGGEVASHEVKLLIAQARDATAKLRDAARQGIHLDFRQRDPLVAAIHRALDHLEAIAASAEQA